MTLARLLAAVAGILVVQDRTVEDSLADTTVPERFALLALLVVMICSQACDPGARVLYAGRAECRAGKVYMVWRGLASRFAMSAPEVGAVEAGEQAKESRKREHSTVDEDREEVLGSDELTKAIK